MGSLQAARHRTRRRGVPSARQGRLPAGEDELRRLLFSLAPLAGRAIAYGIFPAGVSTSRPCERRDPYAADSWFGHWSRGLFSLLRPGVMGPCVRRDDLLRVCSRPRPHQRAAQLVICDSPALAGRGKTKERPAKPGALPFDGPIAALPYVEYLNSGIAFSSSLVALNTAWSGYHGLDFGVVAVAGGVFVVAAPVVVDDAGRLPGAFGAPATPV